MKLTSQLSLKYQNILNEVDYPQLIQMSLRKYWVIRYKNVHFKQKLTQFDVEIDQMTFDHKPYNIHLGH